MRFGREEIVVSASLSREEPLGVLITLGVVVREHLRGFAALVES